MHLNDERNFWGITTFFNPAGYSNKIRNYKVFRNSSKKQGLKLLAVELAYGDKPFELSEDDADILIQIRADDGNLLWQKERMLNIGLSKLPGNCDKIAWLDCDVIFKNNDWVKETVKLLEKYKVVQLFKECVWLRDGERDIKSIEKLPFGNKDGQKMHSRICGAIEGRNLSSFFEAGHTGFAWASRRDVFGGIGFYDKNIMGSGDLFMAHAFCAFENDHHFRHLTEGAIEDYLGWSREISKRVGGKISYTDGVLLHLWHGKKENRNYDSRHLTIKRYKFDPAKDIIIDKNGLWRWSKNNPEMYHEAKKYFLSRNEDGNLYRELTNFISRNFSISDLPFRIKSSIKSRADRTMGFFGILIKKVSPSIYYRLKTYLPGDSSQKKKD